MRVAIVIDSLSRGGAERQALYTVRGLRRQGSDAELLYYYLGSPEDYDLSLAGDARVEFISKDGGPLGLILRMVRRFRQQKLDVVHSFKNVPCVYGGLAGYLARVPVVIGGYRVEYEDEGVLRLAHRIVNRLQSGWVVNSQAIVESLVREVGAHREHCFVVRNAVDPASFRSELSKAEAKEKLDIDPECPVVSIVANLRPQKNHRMFLEVARKVRETHPQARFLIVGDGTERSLVDGWVEELGLAPEVRVLGVRLDVPDILAATDISLLTSDYEGVSNSLLESMGAALTVVSTAYPGVEELITDGHDGRVTPLRDAPAMAATLRQLIDDPAERSRLGSNAQETIETRYGIDVMTTALLEVYERYREDAGRS